MLSRRTVVLFLAAFGLVWLLPQTAAAEPAKSFVQEKHRQLTSLLHQKKSAANDAQVQAKVDELIDYAALTRKSLGTHWDELNDGQRRDFQDVLTQLVRRAYQRDLRRTLSYEVTFGNATPIDGATLVATVARNRNKPREPPIRIDYVLHQGPNGWQVFDIVTDGSSLVSNYRSQFHQVIRKKGFDVLLGRLRKKLERGES